MARYLLDTDALIDYLAGVHDSVSLIRGLHDGGDTLCTCDVVVAEVCSGLRPEDQAKAAGLIDSLHFISTSRDAARVAGVWRYFYARRGVTLATTDVLVAAAAYSSGSTVVTANVGDYPMGEVRVLPLPRWRKLP